MNAERDADMAVDRQNIADFARITSGVLGRLVISLVYFLIVANTLTVGDFGLFAAASAVGLVLSRLLAFGFISPVYRVATVRHRLLGAYLGGLGALALVSLPIIAAIAWLVHILFFSGRIGLVVFLIVVAAEVIGGRVMEFSVITLNGLSRFGSAARLVIIASSLRTLAAITFFWGGWRSLEAWAWLNCGAALLGAALGLVVFMPRVRLRFRWQLYPRRLKDAILTAASELAFFAQGELDKVLVLTLAGERTAGVYAIAMRLVDLTAIPVRSFAQLLVQATMRQRIERFRIWPQLRMEGAVAVVSIGGLLAIIALLWPDPGLLGGNVGRAAPLLPLLLLVPAFRNLLEVHSDMLYARELAGGRLLLLIALGGLKFSLMAMVIGGPEMVAWAIGLNSVFAAVYCASALATYGLIRARQL
jgi:O-antigen/teichoic acid export membrane protein